MAKFKIGDRVMIKNFTSKGDAFGTILESNSSAPFIRTDEDFGGHDCDGRCEVGHGTCIHEDELELIERSIPTNTITLILGNTAYEITGENITIKIKEL